MGELFDQFVIELKNLAKVLKIEEVKEEHHSIPYAPKKERYTPSTRSISEEDERKEREFRARATSERLEREGYYGGVYASSPDVGKFKAVKPLKLSDWRRGK